MLDGLDHDWFFPPDDMEYALHTQQIFAVRHHQGIKPVGDVLPFERLVIFETKRSDIIAVTIHVQTMRMVVVMAVPIAGRNEILFEKVGRYWYVRN